LKSEPLIRQAHAEVLKMTANEWMTVGEGTVAWVLEMILQPETIDVSDFYTGLRPAY
jgi:hypothetical protein